MFNEGYLYVAFALLFAWVIYRTVVMPFYWRWRRNSDTFLVLETILYNLSFQWKFCEEIEEGLFTSTSPELQDALNRILGGNTEDRRLKTTLVHRCVSALEELGQVTTCELLYSRRMLHDQAYRFQFLPKWRKEECEKYLEQVASYNDDEIVFLGGSMSLFGGVASFLSAVEAGDVGVVLIQVKKRSRGNFTDSEEEEGLQPTPRPVFT